MNTPRKHTPKTIVEINGYISLATATADIKFPDKNAKGYVKNWSILYHRTMDNMLKKDGYRL